MIKFLWKRIHKQIERGTQLNKVKVGFIGTGGWGKAIADRAVVSERIEIIGCYDTQDALSAAFAEKYGGRSCSTLDELLTMDGIQAVFNVTANHAHEPTTIQAAEHGLHVFVEKPIANTVAEGKRMAEACNKAGVTLFIGHCHRRHAFIRKMNEMIQAGDIGQPVMVEANVSHRGGMTIPGAHWRSSRRTCPATPMMQLGIHAIDSMHYLLGNITAANGLLAHTASPNEIDDVTAGMLQFESGMRGYIGACYVVPGVNYFHVYGTEGNLYSYDKENHIRFQSAASKEKEDITLEKVDQIKEEVEEFALCCLGECEPETGVIEGLRAIAVVEAIIESANAGGILKQIKL